MLKQRVITAVLLLALLLPAVFSSYSMAFSLVALLFIAASVWEWARLNNSSGSEALSFGLLSALLGLGLLYSGAVGLSFLNLWIAAGCVWVLLGLWLLRGGVAAWAGVPKWFRVVGGLIGLGTAWLAAIQVRAIGINFLFSVLVLVWAADVFAYFFGRAFGGQLFSRKLAPSISPGKTWEGALGGLLGVYLCAFLWLHFEKMLPVDSRSLYDYLRAYGTPFMLVAITFLSMMSVVGDLVESLFKRHAGVKDSSGLLPGHGGVLDRLDALLPTLPIAMMFVSL
jgi:phosphatidate cytidylyltransferase